jgi:hypothetical protein
LVPADLVQSVLKFRYLMAAAVFFSGKVLSHATKVLPKLLHSADNAIHVIPEVCIGVTVLDLFLDGLNAFVVSGC